MTAAVYCSGLPSLGVPQTQNIAPVLEFNCLYTHDIRRKQKRWQDGFLRFHTFNKRVMVYDVPRNFVGDAHWKADEVLQDGDEVTLEKDGVIVQVAESVGRTETDLTELRKSKNKCSSEKGSSSPVKPAKTPARVLQRASFMPLTSQPKHRSLNNVLGTPRGPIGKAALSTTSPFEQRHANAENEGWGDGRPPKRQRLDHLPTCNVTRTTKTGMPRAKAETPLWARKVDSAKHEKKAIVRKDQRTITAPGVIDLSEDADDHDRFLPGFSSDALTPLSSPKTQGPVKDRIEAQPIVRSSSPAFQTQRLPTAATKGAEQLAPKQLHCAAHSIPPVDTGSVSRGVSDGGYAEQRTLVMSAVPLQTSKQVTSEVIHATGTRKPPGSKPGQTLRMAANAPKKKMLLCQDQLPKKSSRVHSVNTEKAVDALLDATVQDEGPTDPRPSTQCRQLEERLARISKKNNGGNDGVSVRESPVRQPELSAGTAHAQEQNASELAQLDRMILPPVQPSPPVIEPPAPENRQLRRVVSELNKPSGSRPKRVPGAPVRVTPSPSKKSPSTTSTLGQSDHAASPSRQTTAPQPKPRGKKPLQRAVTLSTTSSGTSTVILSKPFQTPKAPASKPIEHEKPADPWSREAFDLFTWRPPGWDEERWCREDK